MALADYTGPTCPTDCGALSLPGVDIAECVDSIQEELSEITDLYVVGVDANGDALDAPGDWTLGDVTGWGEVGLLDQTTAGKIRHLIVSGDKPDTEDNEVQFTKFRTKVVNRNHTINADIDDISDLNYEFMRQLQCGATVRFWYATYGGQLYGGATGILADVKANFSLERGEDSRALIKLALTWKRKYDPPRTANPIA